VERLANRSGRRRPMLAALLVALAPMGATARADGATKIPFETLLEEFLAECDLERSAAAAMELPAILEAGPYVRLRCGGFVFWAPRNGLEDKEAATVVHAAFVTAVETQRAWLQWAEADNEGLEGALEDSKTLHKWVRSWAPRRLGRLKKDGKDLLELLGAKERVLEASARLAAFAESGIRSRAWDGGHGRTGIDLSNVLFVPTRRSLLQHAAWGGLANENQRSVLWNDSMVNRSAVWCGRTQIVGLEDALWPVNIDKPFLGQGMDEIGEKRLAQHVVDRLATSLLRDVYYYYGTHFFEGALATNLVIDVVGRNNIGFVASTEWSRPGARTAPYSRFVPGGNPAGGVLPKRRAIPGPAMKFSFGTRTFRNAISA